jgi:hypothetical protein
MMLRIKRSVLMLTALIALVFVPTESAWASLCPTGGTGYMALRCNGTSVCPGTTLYDQSFATGACHYTGVEHILGTVICQFVVMLNFVLGKLYCSIQGVAHPLVAIVLTIFVMIYGAQMLMGTAQLNSRELMPRLIKLSLVIWLTSDTLFGVSAGIGFLFNFFLAFIVDTTKIMMSVLGGATSLPFNPAGDYGIFPTFEFLDQWIYKAFFDATFAKANEKVVGFFIAMAFAMPPLAIMAVYWLISLAKVMINALITFLMALVAIAFLLGLSPVFLCFMLFSTTYQFFDTWLRFMMSFCIQVLVGFAILTMWVYSLTLFIPFFNQLTSVIFPYTECQTAKAAECMTIASYGLCPLTPLNPATMSIACQSGSFNPVTNATDRAKVIPPSRVPELKEFIYYLYYHLITLIIVSFGFSQLQKNAQSIAKELGGPQYAPTLTGKGFGNSSFGNIAKGGSEARGIMNEGKFNAFGRRHDSGGGVMDKLANAMKYTDQIGKLTGKR